MAQGWSNDPMHGPKMSMFVVCNADSMPDFDSIKGDLMKHYKLLHLDCSTTALFSGPSDYSPKLMLAFVNAGSAANKAENEMFEHAARAGCALCIVVTALEHVMCLNAFRNSDVRNAVKLIVQHGNKGDSQRIGDSLPHHFPMAGGAVPVFSLRQNTGAVLGQLHAIARGLT